MQPMPMVDYGLGQQAPLMLDYGQSGAEAAAAAMYPDVLFLGGGRKGSGKWRGEKMAGAAVAAGIQYVDVPLYGSPGCGVAMGMSLSGMAVPQLSYGVGGPADSSGGGAQLWRTPSAERHLLSGCCICCCVTRCGL